MLGLEIARQSQIVKPGLSWLLLVPGLGLTEIGCDHLPPNSALCGGSAMQEQGGGAPTWPVVVHWVSSSWGFPGGTGQGRLPPVFCLG